MSRSSSIITLLVVQVSCDVRKRAYTQSLVIFIHYLLSLKVVLSCSIHVAEVATGQTSNRTVVVFSCRLHHLHPSS